MANKSDKQIAAYKRFAEYNAYIFRKKRSEKHLRYQERIKYCK